MSGNLVAAAATLAIAATAVAAPATAAPGKGTIGLVNGKPGTGKVDFCINGREIKSRVGYGARTYRLLKPGPTKIKVFRADPRECKGTRLGTRTITLAAGDDYTIVFTKRSPRFVVFENFEADIPAAPAAPLPSAPIYFRHAADLGDVTFKVRSSTGETPVDPMADPVWQKGDTQFTGAVEGVVVWLRATRPDKQWTIASSRWVFLRNSRRHEWILLGTKPSNAKLVVWVRRVVDDGA